MTEGGAGRGPRPHDHPPSLRCIPYTFVCNYSVRDSQLRGIPKPRHLPPPPSRASLRPDAWWAAGGGRDHPTSRGTPPPCAPGGVCPSWSCPLAARRRAARRATAKNETARSPPLRRGRPTAPPASRGDVSPEGPPVPIGGGLGWLLARVCRGGGGGLCRHRADQPPSAVPVLQMLPVCGRPRPQQTAPLWLHADTGSSSPPTVCPPDSPPAACPRVGQALPQRAGRTAGGNAGGLALPLPPAFPRAPAVVDRPRSCPPLPPRWSAPRGGGGW